MEFLFTSIWAFSLIPLVFIILFLWKSNFPSNPQRKLPPSPPKLPIVGNLFQLGLHPHRSLQSLSRKYGPLMLLHLGSRPTIVASSADVAREIMKTHDLIFSNRPKSSITDRLLYGSKDVAFTGYGDYWRQVRSICVLHLLSQKRVQSYQEVREEETSLMIENIKQICSSSSSSSTSSSLVNLSHVFVKLTSNIVCRVALGRKYCEGENGEKIKKMLVGFLELLGVFCVGDYIPSLGWLDHLNGLADRLGKVSQDMDVFLENVIEEHRNRKSGSRDDDKSEARGSDFVDIFLQLQRENLNGFQVEHENIKAVIMDIFAAGTDTSYAVMDWAMVELLRHPKVLEKLQTEVRQVVQENSQVTEDDLHKMHYLKAVIKETLRLHAPIPLLAFRELTQDVKLMGYDLSAGTQVIVNAWAIGRDPSSWEMPEEFMPERFLHSDVDFRGLNFELIPFGAGRRGCPGVNFAMAVIELALAKLLHKFNFALPDGAKPEEMDMTEATGIAIHRKLPLNVVATLYSG